MATESFYKDDPVEITQDITMNMLYDDNDDFVVIHEGTVGVISVDDYYNTGWVVVDFEDHSSRIKTDWIKLTNSNNLTF